MSRRSGGRLWRFWLEVVSGDRGAGKHENNRQPKPWVEIIGEDWVERLFAYCHRDHREHIKNKAGDDHRNAEF